jgi:hypothetical protein
MSQHLYIKYNELLLPELIAAINTDYYNLMDAELAVQDFIQFRKEVIAPYVHELFGKVTTGHNCISCSGTCEVRHTLKTVEFKNSIEALKVMGITGILPVPLMGAMNEMLYIEEHILMPKILEAQKEINVHS